MGRRTPLSKAEREAWAVLVMAREREQRACREERTNVEQLTIAMHVASAAAKLVAERSGVDLDDVFAAAEELHDTMWEQGKAYFEAQQRRDEEIDAAFKRAEELMADIERRVREQGS